MSLAARDGRLALAETTARALLDPVLALVFPSRCPACHVFLDHPSRGPLCEPCWKALPRHRGPLCRCGFPLPREGEGPCGRCRRGLTPFTAGASLGPYEGSLRLAIHELKYRGRRRAARRLVQALLETPHGERVIERDAVLVPVPLHPRRHRERGFNQAELLASEIRSARGVDVCAALVRRKDTPPQTGLTAVGRRQNVAGAFAVRRRARIAGRVVVLVDDVLTTGATARACAQALRAGGAAEVRLLTVARVS